MRLGDLNDPSITDEKMLIEKQALVEETLTPTAMIFNDELNIPIPLAEFQNFVKKSYEEKFKVLDEAVKLSNDFSLICDVIYKVYPHVNNSQIKSKLTRLKNSLLKKIKEKSLMSVTESETDSNYVETDSEI